MQSRYSPAVILCMVLALACLLLPPIPVAGQANQPDDKALAQTLDKLLAEHFPPNAPGAAVIVTRGGKPILRKGYGLSQRRISEYEPPLRRRRAALFG